MRSIRRAFTLVELLAVMAIFSVTMSIIALTLHGLQRAGDRVQASVGAGIELDRFAMQLREDTHAAREFALSAPEPADSAAEVSAAEVVEPQSASSSASTLTLTLPGQQIVEYRLSSDRIQRRVNTGDVDLHRESYRLRPVLEKGWTLAADTSGPLITVHLHLASGPGNHPDPLAPLSVQCAVGLASPESETPSN
ncbi:MAG: PulJ/GspJ family protein [Pirellulaceae bacterium]